MKVIGIAGKAGSGKNTVAGILAGMLVEQGFPVALDAFAAGIKHLARKEHAWNGEKDLAGRQLLQEVGARGREIREDFWVQMCDAREPSWTCNGPSYRIICDVRYLNEVRYVREHGTLWIVTGRGGLTGDVGQHASEVDLDEIERNPTDTEFINNSSLERLVALVRQAVADGRHDRALM